MLCDTDSLNWQPCGSANKPSDELLLARKGSEVFGKTRVIHSPQLGLLRTYI